LYETARVCAQEIHTHSQRAALISRVSLGVRYHLRGRQPFRGFVDALSLSKHRLELFTDAVLAIVMTIMVLDLHTPESSGLSGWIEVGPSLFLYLIGFVLIVMGIIIHHDYFAHFHEINRGMVWGNFVFVFFVSLLPLLLRAAAAHPRDSFDIALLPLDVLVAGLGLSAMRVVATRKYSSDPDFQKWYRHRQRTALWAGSFLILTAALAFVSVYITLAMFVIFAIAFVATF
jgi:uncharacterized membrane protein